MAGRPRSRSKRAAAAGGAPSIPEATPDPTPAPPVLPTRVRAHDARVHAPADARAHGRPRERTAVRLETSARPATTERPMAPGPSLRAAIDRTQAATVEDLARVMHGAVVLRVHRLLPVWCEGWCEDFPTEPLEGLGSLLQHLEDEWGGRRYKVTALGEGEAVLTVAQIAIAGTPKWRGSEIDRARWEGRSDDDRTRALVPHLQQQPPGMFEALVPLFTALLQQQQVSSQQQLEGLRDVMKSQGSSVMEVVKQLARNAGGSKDEQRGPVEQLEQLMQTTAAIERVRKVMVAGSAATRRGAPAPKDADPMKAALGAAAARFVDAAVSVAIGSAAAPAAAPATGGAQPVGQLRPVAPVQRASATENTTIPEAISEAGQ